MSRITYTKEELEKIVTELTEDLIFHDINEVIQSLKLVHTIALYHSDIPIDKNERSALFILQMIWEHFEK